LKANCSIGAHIVRQQLKTVQTSRAEVVGNEYINHDYCELFFSREMVDRSRREKKRTRNVRSDEESKEAIAFMDDRPRDKPEINLLYSSSSRWRWHILTQFFSFGPSSTAHPHYCKLT